MERESHGRNCSRKPIPVGGNYFAKSNKNKPMKLRALVDLVGHNGIKAFSKGEVYKTGVENYGVEINDETIVVNDYGDQHILGGWCKFFEHVIPENERKFEVILRTSVWANDLEDALEKAKRMDMSLDGEYMSFSVSVVADPE
jgi:hypothetical protein